MTDRRALGLALAASVSLLAAAPGPSLAEDTTSGELVVAVADDESVAPASDAPDATPEPWPWRLHFSLYGWLPAAPATISVDGVDTSIPERFSRILGDMEFSAMGDLELYKGPIGVFVSPIFYRGRDTEHFEGLLERRKITLQETVWVIDYGASFVLGPWPLWWGADAPTTTLEPFGGARFLHDPIRLKINAGVLEPAQTLVRKTIQFNTPIVGARTRTDLTKRWGLFFQGDYGGWDADHVKETWNFGGTLGYKFKLEARPRRGHLEGVLLDSEPSEPEGSDSNEERESQGGGRSPSRGRRHQHQVGHGGGEGDLESGLGLAEVFRLPNPELNQAADPVLDRDSPAVALSESLRPLLLAQTPERFRLLGDLQDTRCCTTLRARCA